MITGIIAGSGLQTIDGFTQDAETPLNTPWGEPSMPLKRGTLAGNSVLFINRHGVDHRISPHKINYRANLWALHEAGAGEVIALNVVGAINSAMLPGQLVVPDQIIDYTWGRAQTYCDVAGSPLQHVDFTWPYNSGLRARLIDAANAVGIKVHSKAVQGVTQGPRLETAAEVERLARDGCDMVGMTGMPEAALARELDLPYACLALVVNPAAGKSDGLISMQDIRAIMERSRPQICQVLAGALGSHVSRRKSEI